MVQLLVLATVVQVVRRALQLVLWELEALRQWDKEKITGCIQFVCEGLCPARGVEAKTPRYGAGTGETRNAFIGRLQGANTIVFLGVPLDLATTNRPGSRFGPRPLESSGEVGVIAAPRSGRELAPELGLDARDLRLQAPARRLARVKDHRLGRTGQAGREIGRAHV